MVEGAFMTRQDYAASICSRLDQAVRVPFQTVAIADWSPKVAECHENVDRWVREHPGYQAVRGWVTYRPLPGGGVQLTAHSVLRGPNGALLDITPLGNEAARCGMSFVEHTGEDGVFFEIEAVGIFLDCPGYQSEADDSGLPYPEILEPGFSEMLDDEDE